MSVKPVPCWTVICDACKTDLAQYTDYAGMGPTDAEARDYMLTEPGGVHICEVDICEACVEFSTECASCGETDDVGFWGNCMECWEKAERRRKR